MSGDMDNMTYLKEYGEYCLFLWEAKRMLQYFKGIGVESDVANCGHFYSYFIESNNKGIEGFDTEEDRKKVLIDVMSELVNSLDYIEKQNKVELDELVLWYKNNDKRIKNAKRKIIMWIILFVLLCIAIVLGLNKFLVFLLYFFGFRVVNEVSVIRGVKKEYEQQFKRIWDNNGAFEVVKRFKDNIKSGFFSDFYKKYMDIR